MSTLPISVLIPTRIRPFALSRCVENLVSTAQSIDNFEIIFKIDSDDVQTIDTVSNLELTYPNVRKLVTPQPPRGYQDIFIMYNQLASVARGNLLWIFNDDAVVLSSNWDVYLMSHLEGTPKVIRCKFPLVGGDSFRSNIFPIVDRRIMEVQGTLGIHSSIDVQYEILSTMVTGIEVYEPRIEVEHLPGLPQAHAIDKMPAFDPGTVRFHREDISVFATKLKETYGYHT